MCPTDLEHIGQAVRLRYVVVQNRLLLELRVVPWAARKEQDEASDIKLKLMSGVYEYARGAFCYLLKNLPA